MTSKEEIESAHKKALKNLDGEKRAALKKAKGTKGKKAKSQIAVVEEEFANRLKLLQEGYEEKLKSLEGEGKIGKESSEKEEQEKDGAELSEKERKQLKARRKKERQKERAAKDQEELEREAANAGPSLREVELEQIQAVLEPLNLMVEEVEADGHCLYRAVAAQTATDFQEMRGLCADTIKSNQSEFEPFCEYTDDVTSFDEYCDRVRNSAEWGGHLELRALSLALKRPIHVYSVQSGSKPLEIHDDIGEGKPPIRLSYHLHHYALGEHYNRVVET